MIKTLFVNQYDLQPYYEVTVKDSAGAYVDLTGATIYCTMKNAADGTVKINRQTAGITIDPDQITNKGQFHYAWQASDTDTPSTADASSDYEVYKGYIPYYIEFEINPSSGGKYTMPNPEAGHATVVIVPGLDAI